MGHNLAITAVDCPSNKIRTHIQKSGMAVAGTAALS